MKFHATRPQLELAEKKLRGLGNRTFARELEFLTELLKQMPRDNDAVVDLDTEMHGLIIEVRDSLTIWCGLEVPAKESTE